MTEKNEIKDEAKRKSLFSIVADASYIVNQILDCGGEISDELMSQLDVNESELASKVDNYYAVIDRLENEEKFLKEKALEFTSTARVMKNTKDRMKQAIKSAMLDLKKDEIMGENWRFKISKLKDKMILNEKYIEKKYYSEKTESFLDKDKIIADLNFGQKVEGVSFEENYSLRKSVAKMGRK